MSSVTLESNSVTFGEHFSLLFFRTLRIPEDGKIYPLPPGLGEFTLHRVGERTPLITQGWHADDIFLCMYQREALWLGFEGPSWRPHALKIGIGNINALTGEAVASDDLPALVGRGQAVGGLLNINADSVAGEIAAALGATRLIFLTDVPGVKDAGGAFVTALDADECEALIQSGAIGGGMIPKVEACVRAADAGVVAMIVDGREADALQRVLDGSANGTRIG